MWQWKWPIQGVFPAFTLVNAVHSYECYRQATADPCNTVQVGTIMDGWMDFRAVESTDDFSSCNASLQVTKHHNKHLFNSGVYSLLCQQDAFSWKHSHWEASASQTPLCLYYCWMHTAEFTPKRYTKTYTNKLSWGGGGIRLATDDSPLEKKNIFVNRTMRSVWKTPTHKCRAART